MKILLSNDDGYQAPGLAALAASLGDIAEVTVIAPAGNCSCASSSLTVRSPVSFHTADNGMIYVDGTPGDCVHFAVNGMLDIEPDMVVSGINAGANLGDDVIYSGTVAAAIEGRFLGLPAIAVSLVGDTLDHYDTAARVVSRMITRLESSPLPQDTILNVNVPDLPWHELKGIRTTRCGARHRSQAVTMIENNNGIRQFRIGPAGNGADAGEGTDFHAVANGYASVTPIQIDMTRYSRINDMANWVDGVDLK